MAALASTALIGLTGLFGLGYIGWTLTLMGRHARRARLPVLARDRIYQRPVSVIVPVKTPAPGLSTTVQSILRQDYDCPIQLVMVFQDRDSPEHAAMSALAQSLHAANPARKLTLVQSSGAVGLNPKNSNLIQGVPRAEHSWLYFCDADTAVAPDFLARAMACVRDRKQCYATAISMHRGMQNMGARLEAVSVNFEMPAYFMIMQRTHGSALNGACMLMHRDLLAAAGGVSIAANTLTDDLVIGRALVAAGGQPTLLPTFAQVELHCETLRGFWQRLQRWLLIAKYYDKKIFWCAPLGWQWLHLLWMAAVFHSPWALVLSVNVLAARVVATWLFGSWAMGESSVLAALHLPIFDVLTPVLWLSTVCKTSITWAGQTMNVGADGVLQAATPVPGS